LVSTGTFLLVMQKSIWHVVTIFRSYKRGLKFVWGSDDESSRKDDFLILILGERTPGSH
jgi:hypothetical protein